MFEVTRSGCEPPCLVTREASETGGAYCRGFEERSHH